jgi:GTP-binding protein
VSSVSGRDPVGDYEIINRELAAYDERLAERPQIVVATKLDALDEPGRLESLRERAARDGMEFLEISSATNRGVRELVQIVARRLDEIAASEDNARSRDERADEGERDAR